MRRSRGKPTYYYVRVATACLLAAVSLAGCKKAEPAPEVEVTVQAAKPVIGPISEQITGDAILAPLAQASLSPKISAPVKKFYVQRGSHVTAGQLLVSLEDKDLAATAVDNGGTLTAAEATYQQTTKAQVPEDVQKAELDVAQAKANLNLNQSIVNGRKKLFAEGAIPGRDLDTAQAALVQAQVTYDTATKHLQSVQNVGRAATDKNAQGQLTSAKGKFENAQAMLSYASLRSPIDGVVTDRPLFAGETAQAGTSILTVMDTSSLLAKIHLAQAVSQRMKVGDKAQVTVPGVDDPVSGVVSLISPALDPGSTTVEVWVQLNNPDGKLKVGTPVHLAIVGRTVNDALQIPTEALVPGKDGAVAVMVVGSDGAAHLKPVQTGIRLRDKVQVTSGISANDMVISSGAYGIDDGTKVKIGAADDAAEGKD
ncbi:MAG TPA: efflux RND transporter periplasmic adaptor subunit [Acidobacteriaceae bacterium]